MKYQSSWKQKRGNCAESSNSILFPKLPWPSVRKIILEIQKNFWISRLKSYEITRTIYSISEMSEQFLKQNSFLTYSWRFQIEFIWKIIIRIRKIYWDLETCRKVRKCNMTCNSPVDMDIYFLMTHSPFQIDALFQALRGLRTFIYIWKRF